MSSREETRLMELEARGTALADGVFASENELLRQRVGQLEESLRAIHGGEIDALFLGGGNEDRLLQVDGSARVFTLAGADRAYQVLVEEMAEGALTLTPAGVVVYANRRLADMLGTPLATVIGSRIASCFAPEGRALLSSLLALGPAGRRSAEVDLLTGAGRRVPTLASVRRLVIEGVPDAICMVVTDLTLQKLGEVALEARQTLLKVIDDHEQADAVLRTSLATLHLHDNALGAISQGVVIADADGHTTYANQASLEISGYSAADMAGQTINLLQMEGAGQETNLLRQAMAAAQPFHGEVQNYRKDGTAFRNELSVTPVFDEQGVPTHFVGVMRDVTARFDAAAQLLLAAHVFDQSSEGFIITDAACSIVKVNRAFTTICGYSEAEVLGRNPRLMASGRHDATYFRCMWEEISRHGRWQGEIWNARKDGSCYLGWLSVSRIVGSHGETIHYIASFTDITLRKEAEEAAQRLAHYDPLTGLPNRMLLGDRANQAMQIASRSGGSLALMFIDLDDFKKVNDSLGHGIGDRLLTSLAARFSAALRDQDTLSRLGGDEFVLLLPGTDASGAARVAKKLLDLTRLPHHIDQHELKITPSIGIAVYPADARDLDSLTRCADAAMYRAKQGGRNAFCFYTADIQARYARVLLLEGALRHAVSRNELLLHYQPQQSLRSGRIIGVEALLRWQHPVLGAVSPTEFIPIAEGCGLIASIGEWVLRTAVHQLRVWLEEGMVPIMMAVNVSPVQFRQPQLPDVISGILREEGIPAGLLELELTESIASDTAVMAVMNRLHTCGVRLSIDDFGTGYSSLGRLKQFKVNKLKIDQSFIRGLSESAEDRAIVTATIALAKSLGMGTIAEGVETSEQLEYLCSRGCDEIQGYLFSKPLPAAGFRKFAEAHASESNGAPRPMASDRVDGNP
jgi:diguanylate cyclase (GGDEF)-like protein/PAS domain S-box-containing protein